MSILNRSLAMEAIDKSQQLVNLLPMRHLSISNASTAAQPACPVVKVSGNITVSF